MILGHYKGYIGIVKDAICNTVRVELHTTCQTITVDKSRIARVDASGQVISTAPHMILTPASYSSRNTPLFGCATPMHGSKTPHYSMDGSRTPMHGQDGSRTPASWDSSATPRPEYDDYLLSDSHSITSFGTPKTPSTPGRSYSSSLSDICYSPSVGATASYMAPSPMFMNANSVGPPPGSVGYGNYSTGNSFDPMNPTTPGSGIAGGGDDWQAPDMEVRINSLHDDEDLIGQQGVIRTVSGGMCSVFLPKEDRVVSIVASHLEQIKI